MLLWHGFYVLSKCITPCYFQLTGLLNPQERDEKIQKRQTTLLFHPSTKENIFVIVYTGDSSACDASS